MNKHGNIDFGWFILIALFIFVVIYIYIDNNQKMLSPKYIVARTMSAPFYAKVTSKSLGVNSTNDKIINFILTICISKIDKEKAVFAYEKTYFACKVDKTYYFKFYHSLNKVELVRAEEMP